MLKNRKILMLAAIVLFITFANFAAAADPSVFVSPARLEREKGQSFNLLIRADGGGQKVCVVEGKINLNNLSCQNIIMSDGLSVQTSPTCANPAFLLGIQGCDSAVKNLFIITVKANSPGGANVVFSNIDIVGEGVSVSNASAGGNYAITAPVVPQPIIAQPKEQPASGNQAELAEEILEEQTAPQQEEAENPNLIAPAIPEPTGNQSAWLLASAGNILSFGTGESWISILSAIIILTALAASVVYFIRKIRRKQIQ